MASIFSIYKFILVSPNKSFFYSKINNIYYKFKKNKNGFSIKSYKFLSFHNF